MERESKMLEKRYFIAPSASTIKTYGIQDCVELITLSLGQMGIGASVWAIYGAWQNCIESSICVSIITDDDIVFHKANAVLQQYKKLWSQEAIFCVTCDVQTHIE